MHSELQANGTKCEVEGSCQSRSAASVWGLGVLWGWAQGEVASAFGVRLRDGHSIGTPTVGGLGPGALKS